MKGGVFMENSKKITITSVNNQTKGKNGTQNSSDVNTTAAPSTEPPKKSRKRKANDVRKVLNQKIGLNLKTRREAKKLKPKDIANTIHCDVEMYYRWEEGVSSIGIEYLQPLSNVLGCAIEELVSDKLLEKTVTKEDIKKLIDTVPCTEYQITYDMLTILSRNW